MTGALRIRAKSGVKGARIRAYAFESKEPPAEIQLWNAGDNATDYGVHHWTQRSVDEVWSRYSERGNPLLIDLEHNGVNFDGTPSDTGGYARLEIRSGEPWLVFDWSSVAIEQIASRQRLFLSPEYDVDPNTNEIIRLYRVSLVADPGTYRARVLASAATEERNMDPTLAAILAILEGVSDPTEAIASIKNAIASLSSSDTPADPPAADLPGEPQPAFAAADDKDKDEKKVEAGAKPVATSAPPVTPPKVDDKPATAPVVTNIAASAPPVDDAAVRASRENVKKSEDVLRDILLENHGDRLAPSIRVWASSQPLAVVQGLIKSAPAEKPAAPAKVSATRGAGHGTGPVRKGLEGEALEQMQKAMGTFKASTPNKPYRNDLGDLVLPTVTPTEHRAIQAAAAAKDGK